MAEEANVSTSEFEFQREENGALDIESAIFQALGAASMCWSETPRGVFDSDRAKAIGEALMAEVVDWADGSA